MSWEQITQLLNTINGIGIELAGISTQLKRIANSLETTDKKAKEEMLNKVKQALEE